MQQTVAYKSNGPSLKIKTKKNHKKKLCARKLCFDYSQTRIKRTFSPSFKKLSQSYIFESLRINKQQLLSSFMIVEINKTVIFTNISLYKNV